MVGLRSQFVAGYSRLQLRARCDPAPAVADQGGPQQQQELANSSSAAGSALPRRQLKKLPHTNAACTTSGTCAC